ncbi:MAG: SDR family oxidoreductase [Phycisphaerales bacterium]|jgi:NADP-dependent 3-hydroxy acid dehydrogenase YdfG|nr:SDR family oxidoreductase [Phycisphaerales bacterium]
MAHVAIVTGAGSGIGRAVAVRLADIGAAVVLVGRRRDALESTAEALNGECVLHVGDIRDPDVGRSADAAAEQFGGVSVLVNNAGIMPIAPMTDASLDAWRDTLDTNVFGPLQMIHAALPGMRRRGAGHIVNISSVAGRHPFPAAAVYSASKAALDAIGAGLRAELAADMKRGGPPIRVTTIAPGAVTTDLISSIRDERTREGTQQYYDSMAAPLTADDIAEAVCYAVESPPHVCVSDLEIRPTEMTR